jgi:hypothetical protein
MKRCSSCKEWKDKLNFFKSKNKKDGLHDRCKKCSNIQRKNRLRRARSILRKMKSERGCKYCGQNDVLFLDYHHLDPEQKNENVSKLKSLRTMLQEAAKCDVVCSYCHRRIGDGQYLLIKELAPPGVKLPIILV